MWEAVTDEDYQKELDSYIEIKQDLEGYNDLSDSLQRLRDKIYSYCLLRIDNAQNNLGNTNDSIARGKEILHYAQRSEDPIQIARSHLNLGTRYLNEGDLPSAEAHWQDVFVLAENDHRADMRQVEGWTLIVRAHVLNGKSLYDHAVVVAQEAEYILEGIDNYAGVAAANDILTAIYVNIGEIEQSKKCKQKAREYRIRAKTELQ